MKLAKRIISAVLAVVLCMSFITGCASQGKTDAKAEEPKAKESFKIGFPFMLTSDPTMVAIVNNVKLACKTAGGEAVFENWDFTPDALITASEKLINEGVDGLILAAPSSSVIPSLIKMCTDAQVPFVIPWRHIVDQKIKDQLNSCPYFVGNTQEDDEQHSYNIVKKMSEAGVKNMAVLGLKKGDVSGDMRDAGMERAAKETGMKIVAETRDFATSSDATKAVESFIAAYPEMDGIFITGGAMTQGILQGTTKALDMHNKKGKVKIGMIDFTSGMEAEIDKGYLYIVAGGNMVADPTFSCAMLINKVKGTPLSDKPLWLNIDFINLMTSEQTKNYFKYVEGSNPPYTAEEMKKLMFKFENPEVSADSFTKVVQDYSLEDVMARHKDQVK